MAEKVMVYAGYLRPGETSLQRLKAFEALGFQVIPVNMLATDASAVGRNWDRVLNALFRRGWKVRRADLIGVNRRLVELSHSRTRIDWLWLDKPLAVFPETLALFRRNQPGVRIAEFSPDDMAARHNQSLQFLESLERLDVFVTTKSFNVAELAALGCPRVLFMDNGFDPEMHHPVPITPELRARYGGAVGFIGSYEENRATSMLELARHGMPVRIWGSRHWRQCRLSDPGLKIECRELNGESYAPGICAFDINLCFLRKLNRDQQTTRTVEIPACGAFMLAERTDEHRRLFEEDREAVFFGSDGELVEKCRYYLDHPAERQAIAQAGYRRCLAGYSYAERLRGIVDLLEPAGS